MSRKKRWIAKNSQFNNETEKISISWSSSGSDDELAYKYRKRRKSDTTFSVDKSSEEQFCDEFLVQEESLINNCSPFTNRDVELSPVVYGKFELSPVIVKSNERSLSPVIGKKSKLREIKRKIYQKAKTKQSGITQDFVCLSTKRDPNEQLLASQDRFIIEDETTQNTPPNFQIHDTSTEEIDKIEIEESTPRNTSENNENTISIIMNSSSTNSSDNQEPILFYYKVPKKKRYKKGGLAKKLQKSLQNQRMSVAIWKHEVYLNKQRNCELEDDYIKLKIVQRFHEFNSDFLECCILRNYTVNISDNLNEETKKCVVLLNRNVQYDIKENTFLLYRPYSVKSILYHTELVDCYFNVCKIIC